MIWAIATMDLTSCRIFPSSARSKAVFRPSPSLVRSTARRTRFFGSNSLAMLARIQRLGEGGFYLGSTDVTTDANGDSSYNVTLGVPGTPASIAYTATATDPAGNTSEFSAAFRTKLLNISHDCRS